MPTREKPRNLQDVSHLFLSREKGSVRPGGTVEAVLWLVPLGTGSNRAFMVSGCAAAAAAKGVRVTLLEIGAGLPNIGYYLALDPREYAAAGIDASRLVMGNHGPNLRYVSCTRAETLDRYDPEPVAGPSPHLLVIAFDEGIEHAVIEGIGRRWMPGHGGRPDAVCAFGDPDALNERRTLLAGVRKRQRDAFLLDLTTGSVEAGGGETDETLSVPERLVSSWRNRVLPEDPFFDDVVSNVLQVLSHRRRRAVDHATG
jgi:hypothetical protein